MLRSGEPVSICNTGNSTLLSTISTVECWPESAQSALKCDMEMELVESCEWQQRASISQFDVASCEQSLSATEWLCARELE